MYSVSLATTGIFAAGVRSIAEAGQTGVGGERSDHPLTDAVAFDARDLQAGDFDVEGVAIRLGRGGAGGERGRCSGAGGLEEISAKHNGPLYLGESHRGWSSCYL